MVTSHATYRAIILADDVTLVSMLVSLLRRECVLVEVVCSEQALHRRLAVATFDLVVMTTTVPFAADALIEHKVRYIHRCGALLIVLMRSNLYRHTLRLLGAGVDCCMSYPPNMQRLRRVVAELLHNRIRRVE